ncbi:MAG TPA: hypothetical protein VG838_07660 [Opitutaceae bacterium]|nr:hypothetical protein [Opitutaceae bacterium]
MDLGAIIDEIASQADDFLAGAANREQGRAGISELITVDYPDLRPADRKKVVDGVMAILEREDFFDTEFAGGAFDDNEEEEGE